MTQPASPADRAEAAVAALLLKQDGVISRKQVVACGHQPHYIRRMLRRKNWAAVLPGIYVNHTGVPTWRQRVWAAVLDAAPAAVGDVSVLNFGSGPIHIVVGCGRTITPRKGVVVHRRSRIDESLAPGLAPPRLTAEEAALDIADGAATELTAIATLSEAVNKRLTTGEQLLATLRARPRMRRRDLLQRVCRDIADGTCSVLEHHYFTDVESVHGLPVPQRQVETTVGRKGFRDVEYTEYGVVVELDGRLGHADFVSRDRDMERDLDAAARADRITIRLGTGQVFGRPCSTARKVAAVLVSRGWIGTVQRCPSCPRWAGS